MRCAARDNSKPSGLMVERHAEIAEDESETVRYYLHPVSRMHLYSKIDMPGFTGDAGRPYKDIQQIYLLGLVEFFILTIACINFMNLSTARSVSRAKEVGLRKVVGAYRSHLVKQFLGESLLLSSLSEGHVIGVVKDFHYRPLYETFEPLVITAAWYRVSHLSLRIRPEPETMAFLQRTWSQFLPNRAPTITFSADELERWYRDDQRTGQIFSAAFIIAIFVASLGLLGLAAFTAEQRTKEIGIRKAMGASLWNLVILLCREFVILVGIANLIAYPIIYLAMDRWLQHFAYRIELSATPFALGSLLTLGIALLTISTQAWKAARTNPVETLRYE